MNTAAESSSTLLDTLAIPNRQHPSPNLLTGGAPDAAALKAAAEAGVKCVFDLRPASERSFDEPGLVRSLGMRFLHLPIVDAGDFTLATVQAFDALMAEAGDTPTLLHCASGNRVGALVALRAAWLNGSNADAALALGRAHGLTRMEPIVQNLLASGPA